MSSIQKIRTYVYDTPATYDQFDGGINTNLSNEALEQNELRDGLNCHYVNKSLVNRKGEKLIKRLQLPILDRPQGDFLFSGEHNDYIISVRNGHIYYGLYEDNVTNISMELMLLTITSTINRDNPENYQIGLIEKTTDVLTDDTEGYIYKFYDGATTTNEFSASDEAITGSLLIVGNDYVGDMDGKIKLEDVTPAADNYTPSVETYTIMTETEYIPQDSDYKNTLVIQNTKRVQGVPVSNYFILATGLRVLKITEYYDNVSNSYKLVSCILSAYKPNSWEVQNIGVNNLSPFPNDYIDGSVDVPKTSIGALLTSPRVLSIDNINSFTVKAVVNSIKGVEPEDLYYKWEARIGAEKEWTPIHYWKASLNTNSATSKNKNTVTITNAQLNTLKGSTVIEGDQLFLRCTVTDQFQISYDITTELYTKDTDDVGDYIADQAVAEYSKTHTSRTLIASYNPNTVTPDQEFLKIHSCTKVTNDGNKLLFYDDAYNSCEWFKTVVDQPNYLSYGGNLNFKTSKNEKLIGVVVFDSKIIVYADNNKLGGNISLVTGNGDDYNDGDYYSPYKRKIVNTSVSCDSYNTIQIAENFIIFKYRDNIYILDTNDLDGERIQVVTINDKVKQKLNVVDFPLNRVREKYDTEHLTYDFHEYNRCLKPDEIFSEVSDGFYGIIFPHQGIHPDTYEQPEITLKQYEGSNQSYIDYLKGKRIENVSLKPGLRWKCYFRKGTQYNNSQKASYPWLRDVSKYLNIVGTINIAGNTTFVTSSGELIQFNSEDCSGIDSNNYKVRVATKCYNMELPTLCKLLDNLNIYFNRDFNKEMGMNCYVYNEAGYEIYGPSIEAFIDSDGNVGYEDRYTYDDVLNLPKGYGSVEDYNNKVYVDPIDKPVQVLNEVELGTSVLDRPSFTSKTLTPKYRFPFLSAQFVLEFRSNQSLSLSSLTFSFTSNDMPDFTREQLYRTILKGNVLK